MKRKIRIFWYFLILIFARIIAPFFYKKRIWLIGEKRHEARDNGYWLYKYLRESHPEINAYYVITKSSSDLQKVKNLGDERIVWSDSLRHMVFYWAADYSICSQPFGIHPYDYFSVIRYIQFLKRKRQKTVFLQHGIIKDELSHSLDYQVSGIDVFCCSTLKEQQAICRTHQYPLKNVPITGLCRFDNLPLTHNTLSQRILVMPTFRHWLISKDEIGTPTKEEVLRFVSDDYYKAYASLLSSDRLEKMLEKYNFELLFYPHYSAQSYLFLFEKVVNSERIILADRKKYDVQQLLIDSDVLITDFSSIFFDFAYMKKPEIFYQFDEEKYRSNHYKEGYFVYRRDAFGPVVTAENELLDVLDNILKNGVHMDDNYIRKVDAFFAYTDNNNCERTYKEILSLM